MMTKHRTVMTMLLAALLALAGVATSEADRDRGKGHKDRGKHKTKVFTLPANAGNPEGVAFDRRTGRFYVSEARPGSDGTGGRVWQGRLGRKTLREFLPGSADRPASIGLKVKRGRLYVAGGPAGDVEVYDTSSKELLAQFQLCAAGCFVNDLTVARNGDVFVTESNQSQFVYRIPAEAVRSGGGTVDPIPIAPPLVPGEPGTPNANGIAASRGRYVVFVQSNAGKLFRLDRRTREVTEIPVTGGEVTNGDGIVLKKRTLYVVRNRDQLIAEVKLSRGFDSARVVDTKTSKTFEDPTTAALAGKRLLVVNSDFFPPPVGAPFTVSAVKAP
jgi:hypothetical protein